MTIPCICGKPELINAFLPLPQVQDAVSVLVCTRDICRLEKLNWQVKVISQKALVMRLRQPSWLWGIQKSWLTRRTCSRTGRRAHRRDQCAPCLVRGHGESHGHPLPNCKFKFFFPKVGHDSSRTVVNLWWTSCNSLSKFVIWEGEKDKYNFEKL